MTLILTQTHKPSQCVMLSLDGQEHLLILHKDNNVSIEIP